MYDQSTAGNTTHSVNLGGRAPKTQDEDRPGSAQKIPFILVAEDDDNDAFGMELAFKKVGLTQQFRRVRDGDEVIAYLTGRGSFQDRAAYPVPTLLLMDLKMAGKDGFALLEWLRNASRWKNLASVVLTNSEADSDKEKAYRLGAKSYLVKPADFKSYTDMLKTIEQYWSMNKVPATPNENEL